MCSDENVPSEPTEETLPETRRLLEIMARLRGPDGCPWDAEQTLESLKPYLVEECGEVLEAIETGDPHRLEDELGDLLLQVVFQCEITRERGEFGFEDVARRISDKLVRRHPHVFEDVDVRGADDVVRNWDEIKQQERECGERPQRSSILDDIPRHLPALMRAHELQKEAAKVGFDWEAEQGIHEKIDEEIDELREALEEGDEEQMEEELGDLLFSVVNLARRRKIGAEEALNHCILKFKRRFRAVEKALAERGKSPEESSLEEMDELWEAAKKETSSST